MAAEISAAASNADRPLESEIGEADHKSEIAGWLCSFQIAWKRPSRRAGSYGRNARKGDVFALTGDLGAGKTQFVKGFVAGLESGAEVTSPTFVLVHEYEDGRLPVYHFDFYRLEQQRGRFAIGIRRLRFRGRRFA